MKRSPWARVYRRVESRCRTNPHYLKKGIKNFLTVTDIKKLWLRDKAWELRKPSIDRIDRDGPYAIYNCRFIELEDNLKRRVFKKDLA